MRDHPPAQYHPTFLTAVALTLALLLGACSSVPTAPPSATKAAHAPAQATGSRGSVPSSMPAAGSGRGGYYQDDGPGDNPPTNLLAVPDAEPKLEKIFPGTNKPYVVFGKTYTPIASDAPLKQRGTGSWYGKKFHGQKTSSGERYDMYKMTAAHPTMPLPSYARVTNLSNGNQVIVRVNDRGPFHSSRIIDLSYTAAMKLGYLGNGSSELEVERLLPDEIARMEKSRLGERAVAQNEPIAMPKLAPPPPGPIAVMAAMSSTGSALPTHSNEPQNVPTQSTMQGSNLILSDMSPDQAVTATPANLPLIGLYLQLGAFSQVDNAEAVRWRIQRDTASLPLPPMQVLQNGAVFRLFSGPYMTRADALAAAQKIQDAGGLKSFIVQR
jgi:rare lipoprotein A